jgi:hypothetical protein|tara:strand:+ start:79 stop:465 length:387 start_codon:yes stop_codon:yes gene_type:complete
MAYEGFSPPSLDGANEQTLGEYRFALVNRDVGLDGGPTVHVFGPVNDQTEEILRFDCFRKGPHFHLGISYKREPVVPITEPEPLSWVLDELCTNLPDYLVRAGADSALDDAWQDRMREVATEFRAAIA